MTQPTKKHITEALERLAKRLLSDKRPGKAALYLTGKCNEPELIELATALAERDEARANRDEWIAEKEKQHRRAIKAEAELARLRAKYEPTAACYAKEPTFEERSFDIYAHRDGSRECRPVNAPSDKHEHIDPQDEHDYHHPSEGRDAPGTASTPVTALGPDPAKDAGRPGEEDINAAMDENWRAEVMREMIERASALVADKPATQSYVRDQIAKAIYALENKRGRESESDESWVRKQIAAAKREVLETVADAVSSLARNEDVSSYIAAAMRILANRLRAKIEGEG